ncbi:DUF4856 domain-containing protein [Psychrosphaera aestuarii]|uniref:DUF4856 domain-containing protein n=1 Tax=Psychrosphaera aestuarii TaxID=1266052 RepID=UPI001B343074|nr:DUF4856 domain-containing protein [Psychrosphaera aestuarii]
MFKKSLIALTVIATTLLTACSGSSDGEDQQAPTNINISTNTVVENAAGAEIGTLSATDANSADTFTFATDHTSFVINGTTLSLAENFQLDYEYATSIDLDVTVTDSSNLSFTKTLTINVEDVLDVYEFENKLSATNSVSYSGQVARHVLIAELTAYIDSGLQADINSQTISSRSEALEKLMSFYKMSEDEFAIYGDRALTLSTLAERKQKTLLEISSTLKDLSGKIAGNDPSGQHKDWAAEFLAFGEKGSLSPEGLILHFFDQIADNVETQLSGATRTDINGDVISKVYLGSNGLDYKQLVQKTLLGAVAYSQGTDDYLDATIDGKGLKASNEFLVSGKSYTDLEHQYDEGFGYFGAARDYLNYSDEEIAIKGGRDAFQGMSDSDSDGMIDLNSEYNFGHSQNAAKRDLGTANNTSPTDFTAAAMQAFLQGRAIINENVGAELTDTQMQSLLAQRDVAVANWEMAIAATAVHYINDVTADYASFGTDEFNYADLAKHWSELKGFVISLQFNPLKKITDEKFSELNTLIKDAPVLSNDLVEGYLTDLAAAQLILQEAYEFEPENVSNW